MTSKLNALARETAVVYESEFPGEPLDAGWLGEAYQIDAAAGKIGRTSYAVSAAVATARRLAEAGTSVKIRPAIG